MSHELRSRRHRWRDMFLSAWALIPSALIAGALTVLAGLVAMAADDFDRPMDMGERVVVVLPVPAFIWFGLIIARLLFSVYRRHKHGAGRLGPRP